MSRRNSVSLTKFLPNIISNYRAENLYKARLWPAPCIFSNRYSKANLLHKPVNQWPELIMPTDRVSVRSRPAGRWICLDATGMSENPVSPSPAWLLLPFDDLLLLIMIYADRLMTDSVG